MESSLIHEPRWWESPSVRVAALALAGALVLERLCVRGHPGVDEVVAFAYGIVVDLPIAWFFSHDMHLRADEWAERYIRPSGVPRHPYPGFGLGGRAVALCFLLATSVVLVLGGETEAYAFILGALIAVAPMARAEQRCWERAWDLYRERTHPGPASAGPTAGR